MTVLPAQIIHISIERDWQDVYAFASQPHNMMRWASGLAAGLRQDGEDWIGDDGPLGEIRIRFAPSNPYGVIDHDVTLADGTSVMNSLRVVCNGTGAEVMFTLLRQPGMSDDALASDAAHIARDLKALKILLESES
jgi:hypothetical protein